MKICTSYELFLILVSGHQVADTIVVVGDTAKSEALFAGDSCPMPDVPRELQRAGTSGIAMAVIEGSKVQSIQFVVSGPRLCPSALVIYVSSCLLAQ